MFGAIYARVNIGGNKMAVEISTHWLGIHAKQKKARYKDYLKHRDEWLALTEEVLAAYFPKDRLKEYLFENACAGAIQELRSVHAYELSSTSRVINALDIIEFYARLAGLGDSIPGDPHA